MTILSVWTRGATRACFQMHWRDVYLKISSGRIGRGQAAQRLLDLGTEGCCNTLLLLFSIIFNHFFQSNRYMSLSTVSAR